MVHVYERYAWMITLFIICCLYGLGSKARYDVNAQKALEGTGREPGADILSFGAIIFSAAGCALIAGDYNVRLPVDTNPWHVFILTFCDRIHRNDGRSIGDDHRSCLCRCSWF